jgi:GT2 family glycosyltransferase
MTAVDVVAVTYESVAFIEPWAASVRAQQGVELAVTIVDNASRDGSAERAAALFPDVRILRNPANDGFARATNRGIAAGSAPYVLVCNVDVTLQEGFVATLAKALDDRPRAGSACGKLTLERGVIDSTGLQAYGPRLFADRGHGEPDDGRYDVAADVFGASGAAALYRREMLDAIRIGGSVFDPDYFLYWEDIDLAWRARLAGWSCRYEPAASARHVRGSSSGRGAADIGAYSFIHRLFTIDKNDDPRVAPSGQVRAATALLAAGLARKPTQWRAARTLLARRGAVARKRAEVQALRRVPSLEIEAWFAPLSLGRWALERLRSAG